MTVLLVAATVVTLSAPAVIALSGFIIPLVTAAVTRDLTGPLQIVVLAVLSAVAGLLAQAVGSNWTFPLWHTLAMIGWVALVSVAAHYGYDISNILGWVNKKIPGFVGRRRRPPGGHVLR